MSPKIFIGWTVAAVVTLAAALAASLSQPVVSTVSLVNEPAFPDLRANPDAAARVTVAAAKGSFTLSRQDDGGWAASDKFGYPADSEQVRKLIVELADMRLVERKTSRPERFTRLEVEDVSAEDAKSRRVRVEDRAGEVLAEAIIGKRSQGFTAGQDSGTYLRRPDEDQAWLASGGTTVPAEQKDWLETDIVHLASDSVARVEIRPPDGAGYVAVKDGRDAAFRLESPAAPAAGRELDESALGRLASGLAYVGLKDVMPADQRPLPEARHVARLTTFDGVEVTVELAEVEENHWALFKTRYVGGNDAESEAAEAARALAEELAARAEGWAYEIDGFVAKRLTVPRDQLFKDSEPSS